MTPLKSGGVRSPEGKRMSEQTVPNPGSDEAVAQGCTCPVLNNAHGRGAWGTSGKNAIFWRREDCPLHGTKEKK